MGEQQGQGPSAFYCSFHWTAVQDAWEADSGIPKGRGGSLGRKEVGCRPRLSVTRRGVHHHPKWLTKCRPLYIPESHETRKTSGWSQKWIASKKKAVNSASGLLEKGAVALHTYTVLRSCPASRGQQS